MKDYRKIEGRNRVKIKVDFISCFWGLNYDSNGSLGILGTYPRPLTKKAISIINITEGPFLFYSEKNIHLSINKNGKMAIIREQKINKS